MSVRKLIVSVEMEGLNVSEFCRQHGISRWLFYELRRCFAAEGETALVLRSRAPETVWNRTPAVVEEAIITERKRLETAGLDAGAGSIAFHLPTVLEPGVEVPSEATIWRVLTRRGFIVPQPDKAPKHAHRSFTAERANECWQIDDTPWYLADGTEVKIINIIDDCSRVLIRSKAEHHCTTETAFEAFYDGAEQWDWPQRFLSDNAKAFRFGLAEAVAAIGIAASHSRPYHPQTCGKVERFHQTLKKWLAVQPPSATLKELQTQLDRFTHIYNHTRPHRSLGRRIPADIHAATPKSGPANRPLNQPTDIRHLKVRSNGVICISRRYDISLGAAYIGNTVTAIITGLNCHVFHKGQLIRQLTLNPKRRNQPLYDRPGRPPNIPQQL
ncbi:MAG: transposase [bacterium]|nr:transposase [bacterium]